MSVVPISLPNFVQGQANVECPICGGDGWVCENHPGKAWEFAAVPAKYRCKCGGAGMPCRCTGLR
jgi:hypothetical protein